MKTRTNVTAPNLQPGDQVYIDGTIYVDSVHDGWEPAYAPGRKVTIVKGRNAFGSPVSRWIHCDTTFTVDR